jgi:hypothetical protein
MLAATRTHHVVCRLVTMTSSVFEFAARVCVNVNGKRDKWLSQGFERFPSGIPSRTTIYLEHVCWLELVPVLVRVIKQFNS